MSVLYDLESKFGRDPGLEYVINFCSFVCLFDDIGGGVTYKLLSYLFLEHGGFKFLYFQVHHLRGSSSKSTSP